MTLKRFTPSATQHINRIGRAAQIMIPLALIVIIGLTLRDSIHPALILSGFASGIIYAGCELTYWRNYKRNAAFLIFWIIGIFAVAEIYILAKDAFIRGADLSAGIIPFMCAMLIGYYPTIPFLADKIEHGEIALPKFISAPIVNYVMRQEKKRRNGIRQPGKRSKPKFSAEQINAFEKLWGDHKHGEAIDYPLPYSKTDFLDYLAIKHNIIFHGSNIPDLETIKPIRKSLDTSAFGNRKQIFASPDPIWAMWFALFNKHEVRKTTNACMRVGSQRSNWIKYYHFELPQELNPQTAFVNGTLYLCNAEDFPERAENGWYEFFGIEFEEWGCERIARPLAKIGVSTQDFPYLDQVEFIL
jgi:hypothetical protein